MLTEKLLSTLDESEHNFQNLSQSGLNRIGEMQNLSQNDLDQIRKMWTLSRNQLEQIAIMRCMKTYNNLWKEKLLMTLLKPNQSLAEFQKSDSNNIKIEETRKLFNELKNRFWQEKRKKNRKKFHGGEMDNKYFKELERENILKNEEKKLRKNQDKQEKKYHQEQEKKQRLEKLEKKTLKRLKSF